MMGENNIFDKRSSKNKKGGLMRVLNGDVIAAEYTIAILKE